MSERMMNPVIGDEEDTSTEVVTEQNENSKETEEQQTETEQQDNSQAQESEESVPYHKDKRWIEMYEKAKRVDELEQETMSLKEKMEKYEEIQNDSKPLKVPESFKRLFGDDEEVYKIWKSEQDEREKSLRADIIREINEEKQQEIDGQQKEEAEWSEYFDAEIESLKEDGFKFDDAKLTQFVIDNEITDSRGVYDLKKGLLKMMNTQTKPDTTRKQIAGMTGGGSSTEQTTKDYVTSDDFKGSNRPW